MVASVTLTTQRLLLRPMRLTDADDVYAYARDPDWSRFLPLPSPYRRVHAEEYVAKSVLGPWDTRPTFAITMESRVIGAIDVRINARDAVAELGYSVARSQWGRGLMAEAAGAVIDWAFADRCLAKVVARADILNRQSWRVMEKLGMRREGILRSAAPSDADPSVRQDVVTYSILREEWGSSSQYAESRQWAHDE